MRAGSRTAIGVPSSRGFKPPRMRSQEKLERGGPAVGSRGGSQAEQARDERTLAKRRAGAGRGGADRAIETVRTKKRMERQQRNTKRVAPRHVGRRRNSRRQMRQGHADSPSQESSAMGKLPEHPASAPVCVAERQRPAEPTRTRVPRGRGALEASRRRRSPNHADGRRIGRSGDRWLRNRPGTPGSRIKNQRVRASHDSTTRGGAKERT